MAYVPQAIQQRQGGSGNLIHDGSDDFTPFVLALTENLGGQLKQISWLIGMCSERNQSRNLVRFPKHAEN